MENTNQMLTFTESEMLNQWKTILHLETVRRDCTVERDDGVDLDALLLIHIKQWYAHLLETAPVEWLPVEDLKAEVTLMPNNDGVVLASVPSQSVRPVMWQLDSWSRAVSTFLPPVGPEAELQYNAWTRGNSEQPAAIDIGSHLLLFSIDPAVTPTLAMARCVVRPADGTYKFHAAAFSTIPEFNTKILF